MGYRRQSRIYNLVFEGDFTGLMVQVAGMPVGSFMKLAGMYEQAEGGQLAAVEEIFTIFASKLVAWNLEDEDGNSVPPTVDGMKAQDLDFVLAVISHWVEAMSGVSQELGKASPSGATSQELQLPMEAL